MAIQTLNDCVAAEVRAEMGRQHLTQRQLAARLGWSTTMLSRRINGLVPFSMPDIADTADALRIPVSALISPQTASKSPAPE